MASTQLRDEIDRSFGAGPPPLPVDSHLEAGRRALRRRRTATAALGAVLVLGVGYVAVSGPGATEKTTNQVATDPTPTEAETPTNPPAPADGWSDGEVVRYRDGVLEIRPGAVVHERIPNPLGYAAPDKSAALDLTYDGQRSWNLLELMRDGGTHSSAAPSNGWASFGDWVADQVGQTNPNNGWPVTLVLNGQGEVVATPGTEVLQRTDDPQLGDTFAGPGEPTGAAVVRVPDGQSYFVVWRVIGGELDVITTPPSDVPGASFQELLSYARSQYAGGEGLR